MLDVGRPVRPLITPDDPDAVESCIASHSSAQVRAPAEAPLT